MLAAVLAVAPLLLWVVWSLGGQPLFKASQDPVAAPGTAVLGLVALVAVNPGQQRLVVQSEPCTAAADEVQLTWCTVTYEEDLFRCRTFRSMLHACDRKRESPRPVAGQP